MAMQVGILVSRVHVKKIKTALEAQHRFDRKSKITTESARSDQVDTNHDRMLIPTTIAISNDNADGGSLDDGQASIILEELDLVDLIDEVELVFINGKHTQISSTHRNPLLQALERALNDLPPDLIQSLDLTVKDLVQAFPTTYTIYKPLLMLPSHTFTSPTWEKLLSTYPSDSHILQPIWKLVAASVGATHIALNAGIPPSTTSITTTSNQENILRSPKDLNPIYGDFGPPPTDQLLSHPTPKDFTNAFWVSTCQNGIHQTWAPLYTMFSRGNIREKTRVLKLPSIKTAIDEGQATTTSNFVLGCTAVDLYAGIGYFAFSYKRAGVSKVLCWELNPWSIEGLRRGAEKNGWRSRIYSDFSLREEGVMEAWKATVPDADFLVFQQSNEEALTAVLALAEDDVCGVGKAIIPPVRHVNLGFLPTTQRAWKTAVRALDVWLGGWIHVHENVGVGDLETKKEVVVKEMQRLLDVWEVERGYEGLRRRRVKWLHTEKVKTYAPGVLHVVFDVWVDGRRDAEEA